MKKIRYASLVIVVIFMLSVAVPVSAGNTWAVGNLVGLCAGTPIHSGSGDGYPVHTIVPENNWTVMVIDGPRNVDGQTWWDTSRAAAGDPSGGTGWVKQSEADACLNGGGPGDSDGGETGEDYNNKWGNTFAGDAISTTEPLPANAAPEQASDGFQWPFSQDPNAPSSATGFAFGAVDIYCDGTLNGRHAAVDWDAGHGNPIYAIGKGKVIKVGWNEPSPNRGYGLYIVIWHIAPNGESVYSLYSHLERGTALVKEGQPVNRGDKIARQDTTGGANNVSHLHFEIRRAPYNISVSACPTKTEDVNAINKNFHNPITYIKDFWWQKYPSTQPPSADTLKQDVIDLTNLLGTQTHAESATINQGQVTAPTSFWVNTWDKIIFLYHKIFGSATEIAIYRPDGSLYGKYAVDEPFTQEVIIHDPEPGQWSYTVRGVNIPYPNYPYAIGIGARSTSLLNLNDTLGDDPFETFTGDVIAPTTTLTADPATPNGNNNWYKTPVFVSLSAVDNPDGVGVAETRYEINNNHIYEKYTGPFTLTTEGINTIVYFSVDGSGNSEVYQTTQIKIDLTPPVVDVTVDQPEYTRVQPFIVHYSGYDPEPGSGLADLTGVFNNQSVSDGETVDLFWLPLGQYTLSATGEDYAGWTTTDSKTIKLIATIPSLQKTVGRLCSEKYITKKGICTSLQQKLKAALTAQLKGKNKTAINILSAFKNELKAQKGKSVKLEAYNLLIMDTNYVIQTLR